jgi:hypothetical protein
VLPRQKPGPSCYRQQRCKERFDTIIKDLDKNHDGKISKSEARGLLADDFDQLDTNKDGFIDRQELEKACMPRTGEGGGGRAAGDQKVTPAASGDHPQGEGLGAANRAGGH